jgi:hypothetical protein
LAGPRRDPAERSGPSGPADSDGRIARVISSPFPVNRGQGVPVWGRYVCTARGMALLRDEQRRIESLESGSLLPVVYTGERDPKSGAPICGPGR